MKTDEAIDIVRPHLKQNRFEHTLRVAETAVDLAENFGEPVEKIKLAAILHDYAKYFPLEKMAQIIKDNDLPQDLLSYHHELWHGPVASVIIEKDHGITDADIKNAVRFHTTGRAGMSKFETILFIADYIEPGRSFPGVEDVRRKAHTDLYSALWMALRNTIQFLVGKDSTVYPDTFYAYNDLTIRLNGGNGIHGQ
ncbi:bis(5'-nucleosyl)-tetraphosphatase (symmetrical) YqeK [Lentibacillus sp.]|jgi:predicted HD superfamily hydrolase involved in NAD metabolism|uniref:bis(5'-nucleosyl)-tetraphosphatase (symmetrical) YqeK n=1 Tax=Lentibacillus sp. TaxID=1925746 RepID=UPI002B4B3924|nr:bis(5'-nucleosyl)-tetraphosphatase (symmetrical) YqeK [Lentibacillus sp.]HLS07620.1 bis(5'-nucleosyl)-tetraphosphatase (symmetrical) YqeK [Lentibacillus sp.]